MVSLSLMFMNCFVSRYRKDDANGMFCGGLVVIASGCAVGWVEVAAVEVCMVLLRTGQKWKAGDNFVGSVCR